MRIHAYVIPVATLAIVTALSTQAVSQAAPTATRTLRLSAFGGATGTFTGLDSGKNLGITAGVDLGIRPFFHLEPSLEIRGTYPIDKGAIDSQKNVLGGLKLARTFGRIHPYADILFGRGEIDYHSPGFYAANLDLVYISNTSNVFSPGAGVDFDLTPHLSLKADAQFQRYTTPVTSTGSLYAKPLTLGLVYHFNTGQFPTR